MSTAKQINGDLTLDCELSGCRWPFAGLVTCDFCNKFSCTTHIKTHYSYHMLAGHQYRPHKDTSHYGRFRPEAPEPTVWLDCPDCHRIGERAERTVYLCKACGRQICLACTKNHKAFEELKGGTK